MVPGQYTQNRALVIASGMLFLAVMLLLFTTEPTLTGFAITQPELSESDTGFGGDTRAENYAELLDSMYASGNVTTLIDGDKLWVPWFDVSNSCQLSDLKSGGSCNSGESIDFDNNCMVTDEFSQVGIVVAMGDNQTRMDEFVNTVQVINSSFGQIPAWRVYRDGTTIEPCRNNINGNCDTASDATARIIIALFTASNNSNFGDQDQQDMYWELGVNLSEDMVIHETEQTCHSSDLGYGDICYWLAAGSQVQLGGMASTDFGYTGYYADAIIAMLQACSQTGNMTYCYVAGNYTLDYLQAAQYKGDSFTAPPGRSYAWTNLTGVPVASCTNTCSPDQWDGADAPRALGMCQANYYAERIGYTLPLLDTYCDQWGTEHMNDPTSAPIQFYPNGDASAGSTSGFFAQGLQALFQLGGHNRSLFEATLDDSLDHYSQVTQTFDWQDCFGIYHQAFVMRALGVGIGRDLASFPIMGGGGSLANISFSSTSPAQSTSINEPQSQVFSITLNNSDSLPTSITWYLNGTNQTGSYESTSYTFVGGYQTFGNHTINVTVDSSQNTISYEWTLEVNNTPDNITLDSTSPASSVSIAEPQSQTFNVTIGNNDSLPTSTTWYLDGVNQTGSYDLNTYTFVGSYNTSGTYTVNVTVVSSANTVSYEWTLEVNNTSNNSDNITFESTSPAQSLSIAEPQNQLFNVSIQNNDSIPTTITWYLNGTNQTGSYNANTYTFTGGYATAGNHTINVTVWSTQNTISYQWNMEVNETPPQNISISSFSPTTPLSIAEPSSQEFSIVINNTQNITTSITWHHNGTTQIENETNYTFPASFSSAGQYLVGVIVSSTQNTVTQNWYLTVNDTNVTNISFNAVSPASAATIDEPNNEAFSYVLDNPSNLTTWTTWYLDGVNQTGSYNQDTYIFYGSYSSQGTYNITVQVASLANTVTNEFTLTVNDVQQSSSSSSGGGGGGGSGGGGGGGGSIPAPQTNTPGFIETDEEPEEVSPRAELVQLLRGFFDGTDDVNAGELIKSIRSYFTEGS